MGFARVLELRHGRPDHLRNGVQVEHVQNGRIDSAYWLNYRHESLLHFNDCPVSMPWLTEWMKRHPWPNVALAAFSYASPYPVCYDIRGVDHRKVVAASVERVLGQLTDIMATLQPRYAVPFATRYGFLAPDQLWMNAFTPSPHEAVNALSVQGVVLNPGDRLSLRDGPMPCGPGFDWDRREAAIGQLAETRAVEVREALDSEPQPSDQFFEPFRAYFEALLSRNWLMRQRVGMPVAFVVGAPQECWVVDCMRASARITCRPAEPMPIEIHLPASVLSAAVNGQIHWETLDLSNRLRVKVSSEDLLARAWECWRMLFNFPSGILRDRMQWLTPRGLRVGWRRRRDLLRLVRERPRMSSHREPYRET